MLSVLPGAVEEEKWAARLMQRVLNSIVDGLEMGPNTKGECMRPAHREERGTD